MVREDKNYPQTGGAFPSLINIISLFIAANMTGIAKSLTASAVLMAVIILGITLTLVVSKLLSMTILKGMPSSFVLELPPYRKPQLGKIITRSLLDRTLHVLRRALTVAAPAGIILWLLANWHGPDGVNALSRVAAFLDPFGRQLGMDGALLTAFILGLPANEIVLPIAAMIYMSSGSLSEIGSLSALGDLFISNGWTLVTAVSVIIFTLLHYPCGTTLITIYKETKSLPWTIFAFLLPTVIGMALCLIFAQTAFLIMY